MEKPARAVQQDKPAFARKTAWRAASNVATAYASIRPTTSKTVADVAFVVPVRFGIVTMAIVGRLSALQASTAERDNAAAQNAAATDNCAASCREGLYSLPAASSRSVETGETQSPGTELVRAAVRTAREHYTRDRWDGS